MEEQKLSRRKRCALYERLGSIEALRRVVTAFYIKLLADPDLRHFFDGIDIVQLEAKQIQFMQFAFGGPDAYRGRDIALAHEKLIREHGLNARHFDLVAGYFAESLQELGTPQEHIDEALEVLQTARPILRQPGLLHDSLAIFHSMPRNQLRRVQSVV